MKSKTNPDTLLEQLIKVERAWMFMDYDGTLADFAPTPDVIKPDARLIDLLTDLERRPGIRVVIISGRKLDHLRKLLPIQGIWLAGTYGVEWLTPDEKRIDRVDKDTIRPTLDEIKSDWEEEIRDDDSFFLEDKGFSLALHARFADDAQAVKVLDVARAKADQRLEDGQLGVLGGHKFLEVAPRLADKGEAVDYLLDQNPWPEAMLVYLGDDDKDQRAFETIQGRGGISILVSDQPDENLPYRIESPDHVHHWLKKIIRSRPIFSY
jgi:trehalose 6-phosphate phosphatase